MSTRRCVYYDDATGNMYVVSTAFGTLVSVNAMGTAKPSENDRIWKVAWVTAAQQQFVDGGFLFQGRIIERRWCVAEPTKPEELRAYEALWRRRWQDDAAACKPQATVV